MAYSGRFTPSNPQKYIGDYNNIIYRSSWECRVMDKLDKADWCISWSSEEIAIPYLSPVDGKYHRYFPDFVVKYRDKSGSIKTMMIEIKPHKQSQPPVQKKRVTKQYINEVVAYGINQAKWKSANEYCLDRNWQFRVLTEKELGF
jgi:hypothetical protein